MPLNQALFDQLIGPTLSRAEIATLPNGPYWLNGFDVGSEDNWNLFTYNGAPTYPGGNINFEIAAGNYYGRDHAYAAMWKMSNYSVQKYFDRAVAIAQNWYDLYYAPNNGSINPFQQMNMSMALLYAMTGNEAVRTNFGKTGEYNNVIWTQYLTNVIYGSSPALVYSPPDATYPNGVWNGTGYPDARSRARPLESFILCELIGAPSLVYGYDWNTVAQNALTAILAGRDPTNVWRELSPAWANWLSGDYLAPNSAGTLASPMLTPTFPVKSFEVGMVHDAFQMYFDMKAADTRIPPAMLAGMNYLHNGGTYTNNTGPLYVPANKCYKYVEFAGSTESYNPNGSHILNGFLVNNCAFLYRQGYGAFWKTRAEDLMSVIVPDDLTGTPNYVSKEWNQVYSRSYKAWPMLYGAATPPANPKRMRGKWR